MANLRTFTNRPGITYDEAKTSVIFAEDMNNIGTYMKNDVSAQKNGGEQIELDGLAIQLPAGGNRSLVIKTLSGTRTLDFVSITFKNGVPVPVYKRENATVATTFQHVDSSMNLGNVNEQQEVRIYDRANAKFYICMLAIGSLHNNNFISIRRVL